jgi:hypothetical protein
MRKIHNRNILHQSLHLLFHFIGMDPILGRGFGVVLAAVGQDQFQIVCECFCTPVLSVACSNTNKQSMHPTQPASGASRLAPFPITRLIHSTHAYLTLFQLLRHGAKVHRMGNDIIVVFCISFANALQKRIGMLPTQYNQSESVV